MPSSLVEAIQTTTKDQRTACTRFLKPYGFFSEPEDFAKDYKKKTALTERLCHKRHCLYKDKITRSLATLIGAWKGGLYI